jgi:hypothetical protein
MAKPQRNSDSSPLYRRKGQFAPAGGVRDYRFRRPVTNL